MSQDIMVLMEHVCGKTLDISYMMIAQARQLAKETGGQAIALLLGHNAASLAAEAGADAVWYVDHPLLEDFIWDNYLAVLEKIVTDHSPRLLLFGETTIGSGLASGLSERLHLPLVNYCLQMSAQGEALGYTAQICGGKMMAEGPLPDATALATVIPGAFRVEEGQRAGAQPCPVLPLPGMDDLLAQKPQPCVIKRYIEPVVGDVDITREPILVAVGRGMQSADNLSLAEDLAEALGGAVCGSRPVIDQGWLAASRLVGKSGKTVKPKVYLALGISGAPEHTEGISSGGTLIAVNTDPTAPIFNQAQYGVLVDALDLLPVLTDLVHAEKG